MKHQVLGALRPTLGNTVRLTDRLSGSYPIKLKNLSWDESPPVPSPLAASPPRKYYHCFQFCIFQFSDTSVFVNFICSTGELQSYFETKIAPSTRTTTHVIDSGLVGSTDFHYHESRRCSRDNFPESYITKYSIRRFTL